jgi:hypothetical protein
MKLVLLEATCTVNMSFRFDFLNEEYGIGLISYRPTDSTDTLCIYEIRYLMTPARVHLSFLGINIL